MLIRGFQGLGMKQQSGIEQLINNKLAQKEY